MRISAVIAFFLLGVRGFAAEPASPWNGFVEPAFPFFSSVVEARRIDASASTNNLTPRALVLNLGHDLWMAFDTDLLRVAVVWRGPGLTPVSMSQGSYHVPGRKTPEGERELPEPVGTTWLANGLHPGWQTGEGISTRDPREPGPDPTQLGLGALPAATGRFEVVRLVGQGVQLDYKVGAAAVVEEWTGETHGAATGVRRALRISGPRPELNLAVGRRATLPPVPVSLSAHANAALRETTNGIWFVQLPAGDGEVEFDVLIGDPGAFEAGNAAKETRAKPKSAVTRWPEVVTTRASLAPPTNAFVVDNIALPLENPWRRNVRPADIAFFPDGRAAVVTFDGDVWMVSGLQDGLESIQWRRFASGLHEPLGICVRAGEIFVHDRNGIWRLRDADGNGEADAHELFSNVVPQTAETREFAAGLRVQPDGAFIIAKGGQRGSTVAANSGTVIRISADGLSATTLAWGLRQPFMGVHPRTGLVTASDQEGNYIPTTPLHIIEGRKYGGFIPLIQPKERYPAPIADPLVWIPHAINASGASQVWLADARMGPLNDALIHLGYYRPEAFVVLLNQRTARTQAAVLSLTRDFQFAPLAGAVNPADGQLYVAGFQIFGTIAPQVGGLARVRYTSVPSTLPREVVPMEQGMLLRFDVELDPRRAGDPANYSAERWNYRRSAEYGSPHFRPDGTKGQQAMIPSSVYLSKDRRRVFIGIPDMQPVMQMRLGWAVAAADGRAVEQNAYLTPHELARFDPVAEGFESLTVDLTPRRQMAGADAGAPVTAEEGRRLADLMGCAACHSTDGTTLGKVGPSWQGIFGRRREFADGTAAIADVAYLRESIREPSRHVVKGFEKSDAGMPSYDGVLSDAQIESLVKYLQGLPSPAGR